MKYILFCILKMEVTAPDIATIRELIPKLKVSPSGDVLSDSFVEFLFSQTRDGKQLINQHNKFELIDLIGIVNVSGEETVKNIIMDDPVNTLDVIVRNSSNYREFRRKDFIEKTVDLKERVQFSSIIKCPVCKSNNVEAKTIQKRGGDEPSTDYYFCRNCNNRWSKN